MSRWLAPARTSPGGSKAEGAKYVQVPLVVGVVKGISNDETEAVVEELKEESADVTEQSVLGAVMKEVQGRVRDIEPVFYDLLARAATWSKEQEGQDTLNNPTM